MFGDMWHRVCVKMGDGWVWLEKHTQISNSCVVENFGRSVEFYCYLEYNVREEYHTTQLDRQKANGKGASRVSYPSVFVPYPSQ